MSHIFISYKREDSTRVARLVHALEAAKLPVWWDGVLTAGDDWPSRIATALDTANCVIVVWSRESVGSAGGFVRDEARRAMRRGVLVPVLIDPVEPPLGFGEVQAIDLTRWNGKPRDPSFVDLKDACAARLEGRAAAPATGRMKRLKRRLVYGSVGSAAAITAILFALNLFRIQDHVCGIALLQPGLSDVCGALGLGGRPAEAERIAWESRPPGNCEALSIHIQRFPNGAYRDRAAGMLATPHIVQAGAWIPVTQRLELFVPQDDAPGANRAAAQTAALARAQAKAGSLCNGFAATGSYRVKSAAADVKLKCNPAQGGFVCESAGQAVCQLERLDSQEQRTCGNQP